MRPLIATFVLATLFACLEANAALSHTSLNDETLLTGERELSVEVTDRTDEHWHSLIFECMFSERERPGDVSMHMLFRRPLGAKIELELKTGEQIVKLKFDDGRILDVPSLVEEHGESAYKISVLSTSEEARRYLGTSISSKELIYGLFTVEGEMAQGAVELGGGVFDESALQMQLFDMRCKHPGQPTAAREHLVGMSSSRLRDEVRQDGRRDLRASGGRGVGDGYEFRCLSAEHADPVMMLVHLETRRPRSGRGGIRFEFEGGMAVDAETRISHGVIHANAVVRQARALLDGVMTSSEFTVHIQGRQWDFRGGDLWFEIFRNRCLLE